MLRPEMRHIFRSSEREGLLTYNFVHRQSKKTRIMNKRRDIQSQRSRSQGHVVRLRVVGPLVENEKLSKRLPTSRAITRTRFDGKRSKVNITRPINAETESVSPANFKLGRRLENALPTAMAGYKGLAKLG